MDKKTVIKFNILAIICILIFSFSLAPKTLQNDTYYTISIGKHIMENGIDKIDPFSWHDLKYTYPHWLYDVFIYKIYSIGGMDAIYISTIILCCILGVMLYVTSVKANKKPLFSLVITIGVMYLLQDYIAARAQLVTFILFTLEIFLVESFLKTKKARYEILLLLDACLIANMHAAVFYFFFILLMPYIGEYILCVLRDAYLFHRFSLFLQRARIKRLSKKNGKEEKVEKLKNKLEEENAKFERFKEVTQKRKDNPYKVQFVKRDAVKWLIIIAIICFAMGMLTPLGDEPYTHIFKLMHGNTTQSISEHQPLILKNHPGAITVIMMILILLMFTDTKITLKDLFMIGGLTVLTFMSRRQFTMLALIGGISFTKILCDFAEKYDKDGIEDFTKIAVNWKGFVLGISLTLICASIMLNRKMDDEYINSSSYPVKAADYILSEVEEGNLDLSTMKLFNDYNYGSYLLFRGIPVFIDSRADLYSPEFNEGVNIFSDYLDISGIATWYEDKFKEYGVTHVMSYSNSKLKMLLSRDSNYKEMYSDDHFIIYERLSK